MYRIEEFIVYMFYTLRLFYVLCLVLYIPTNLLPATVAVAARGLCSAPQFTTKCIGGMSSSCITFVVYVVVHIRH